MTSHLIFDGIDDRILVPASATLDNLPLADFTVDFAAAIPLTADGTIIGKQDGNYLGWEIGIYGGAFGVEITYDGFDIAVAGSYPVPDEDAHHFAAVFTLSPLALAVYIDGVAAAPNVYDDTPGSVYDDDSAYPLLMFQVTDGGYKSGTLNWLRISDSARYTDDFAAPSLTVAPAADADTVALYTLDEGTGSVAGDTSGNDNDGAITGAAWGADPFFPTIAATVYGPHPTATIYGPNPIAALGGS